MKIKHIGLKNMAEHETFIKKLKKKILEKKLFSMEKSICWTNQFRKKFEVNRVKQRIV